MMELLAYTVEGLEKQAVGELEKITNGSAEPVEPGRVLLDAGEKAVFQANYLSGTCGHFIYLFNQFQIETPEDAYEAVEAEFDTILSPDQTFVVRVHRHGDHEFSSVDVAREAGQKVVDWFREATGETLNVDLDNPDIVFRLDVFGDQAYFGLDTTGESLDERRYLSKDEADTYPVLANCALRASGWTSGGSLIDPFCGAGVIPIEAGRIACNVPNAARRFAFLDTDFFDTKKYAEVAQDAKAKLDIHELPVEGSDVDLGGAKRNAGLSGLNMVFAERDPLERPLDVDFVVFQAPFIQQKSKRSKIRTWMRNFEEHMQAEKVGHAGCLTRDLEFFENFSGKTRVLYRDFDGWLVRW